jgi:predicted ATPase
MNKISKIQIGGFRRLLDVDIEMRPLMVMIGANGVGKTSVLDAISLLSLSAAGAMNNALSAWGGITSVISREHANRLSLIAEMEVPGYNPLQYHLELEPGGIAYSIAEETLSQVGKERNSPFFHIFSHYDKIVYYDVDAKKLVQPEEVLPNWKHDPLESSLSQVPKMFRQPEELRRVLSSAAFYHALDVKQRAPVKLPQQMKPAIFPGENGEELLPFLYYLRESDKDRYESIEDTLRAAFPSFESLNFPPVAAGMLSLAWKDRYFKKALYPHELSEGTLRFLWLVSLLKSPSLPTITMIDEPEVSMHPELLSILADLMREASERTQIVVATHSDTLIRFLEPKEVVVMDTDDEGFTSAKWADSFDIEKWLEDYSLDEIWRMGQIGGRA